MRSDARLLRKLPRPAFIVIEWLGSVITGNDGIAPAVTQNRPQQLSDIPLSS